MPKVQAKVVVAKVAQMPGGEAVTMHPLYSSDPADPNRSFAQSTPGGEVRFAITNPDLVGKIKEKQVYLVDFTELTDNPFGLPPSVLPPANAMSAQAGPGSSDENAPADPSKAINAPSPDADSAPKDDAPEPEAA